ncbi:MAG TPA: PKD domain-containing protein [Candidatus Bathyarchaeia archaeon]|nr:PKD domain-containing protein [Candidatus Bathyarchaeia archaeon]
MRTSSLLILILLPLTIIPIGTPNTHATTPQNTSPLAAYTYNPCVMCAAPGSVVFFNANTSWSPTGHIASYTWIFGDNSAITKTTSPYTTHDFLLVTPGKWNVSLTVQDTTSATDTITQQVIFNIAPAFTYHPRHPMIQQTVTFNASATRSFTTPGTIKTYQWNYGDNTNATGILTKHAYTASRTYRVTLTLQTTEGPAKISETITVYPRIIIVNKTFDGLNITITAVFTVNATSQTASGTITINATNATTGALVYTDTFDITIPLTQDGAQFILALPTNNIPLGANCHIDQTGQTTSTITRDPDVMHRGTVDITDASPLALAFGATQASPIYNPAADLNADGQIDLLDAAILAADFGTPVLN